MERHHPAWARRRVRLVWLLVPALSLAACGRSTSPRAVKAVPSPSVPHATATTPPATAPTVGAATIQVEGTDFRVPVPPAALGVLGRQATFEQPEDAAVAARGLIFNVPGPVEGTRVGGTSVVFSEEPIVKHGTDLGAIARGAHGDVPWRASKVAGKTLISWPGDHEVVPAGDLPYPDRSVHRYVLVLQTVTVTVVFDGVPLDAATAYLTTLAGAL